MSDRSQDWFRQAERDLDHAQLSADAEQHEWACFAAQQAAEKAVKALHLSRGQEAWGHVVRRLLQELSDIVEVPDDLIETARVLDDYYIGPRYANGHTEGAPLEHYGKLQSGQAIDYAGAIVQFCRAQMAAS